MATRLQFNAVSDEKSLSLVVTEDLADIAKLVRAGDVFEATGRDGGAVWINPRNVAWADEQPSGRASF